MNEDYDIMWDKAHQFQASYGNLMDAVEEAFQLSRQRIAEDEELKRLRVECEKQQREIDRLSTEFAKANKNFVEMISQKTAKITEERDAAVKEAAMWKKSYEDLVKCI